MDNSVARFATGRAVKPRTAAFPTFSNTFNAMSENCDPALSSFDNASASTQHSKGVRSFGASVISHPLSQETEKARTLFALTDATNDCKLKGGVRGAFRRKSSSAGNVPRKNRQHDKRVGVAKHVKQGPGPSALEVQCIDNPHLGSVQHVPAYAQAITENMRLQEVKYCPRPDYLRTVQRNVTADMRARLIDWLVDVSVDFRLVTESLYLTVAYIDKYLSCCRIPKSDLQLLAVSCLCIATKFEEIYPPPLDRLADITDGNCTVDTIMAAERQVLKVLKFHVAVPTAKVFLQRFLRAAIVATSVEYTYLEQRARYLLELHLLDYDSLRFHSSTVAAAAVFLCRVLLNSAPTLTDEPLCEHVIWNKTMQHYTSHTAEQLKPCVQHLHKLLLHAPRSQNRAIYTKYSSDKKAAVAQLKCPAIIDDCVFEPFHALPVPANWLST
eukprot:jgi/Ulvmu1/5199/UM021_0216.1